MTSGRHAVLLAGGLGSRLLGVTGDRIPKALVPVLGRPFLFFKLQQLASLGVTDVSILTGHLGDQIDDFVRNGVLPAIRVRTFPDGEQLRGTGGAVRAIISELPSRFWITYADTLVSADLEHAEELMSDLGTLGLMVVLKNENEWQPSNVAVKGNFVTKYEKGSPDPELNFIDFGLILLDRSALDLLPEAGSYDLSLIFQKLISIRQLGALTTEDMFHDIGTPAALEETEKWLMTGND